MRCEQCRERLAQYGLVKSPEDDAVEAHLAGCARCRAELAAYQRLDELLTPLQQVAPARDLWPQVAFWLRPRRRSAWEVLGRSWRPLVAAAAVLLAVVVGGVHYHQQAPAVSPSSEVLAVGYQEQQIVAEWSQPLADDAALGLMLASLDLKEVSAP